MITIIGTGHIFNLSEALVEIFDKKQPDIFCIELDKERYHSIILKQKNPEKYRESSKELPFIYKLFARFQEEMANEYGVTSGQEMITTIEYAKSHQIPLAFIDLKAHQLFRKMLKKMSLKEKIRLLFSALGGIFIGRKTVEKEINKIENNLEDYIKDIQKKFPTIKRVLIDERNEYMIQRLLTVSREHKRVIAVVGDGHIPGLIKLLKKIGRFEFETIRLSQLRKYSINDIDTSFASFTIKHKEI
jgi:pheromone shutdown-related protein TraB